MPVCYGFAWWSYVGDTDHAERATAMPRKKAVLFRSPVRLNESRLFKKKLGTTWATSRCIRIQYGACRRRCGVIPVGPAVHTVATPGLKTGTV